MRKLIFIVVLFLPSVSFCAVSCTSATNAPDLSGLESEVWLHTVYSTENYLVVGLAGWDTADSIDSLTITFAGTPMTFIGGFGAGGVDNEANFWGLAAPEVGEFEVSVSGIPAGFDELGGGSVSCSGVNQTTSTGTIAVGSGSSDASQNITLTTGDLGIDILYSGDGTTAPVVGAGGTVRVNHNLASRTTKWIMMATEAGNGTVTMSWTDSDPGSDFGHAAIPLLQESSASTDFGRRRLIVTE